MSSGGSSRRPSGRPRGIAVRAAFAAAALLLAGGRRFPGASQVWAGVPTTTTATPTFTPSSTDTPTPTPTMTDTPTATETPGLTATVTASPTPTFTPTMTFTPAQTATATRSPTASMTFTRTSNQTSTPTPPPTPTPLPGAMFSYQPACPVPGQTVSFFYTAQSGSTSWNWNFGDPGSGAADFSTLRTPVHTFATAGRYTVTVTARGLAGFVTTQQVVRVAPTGPLAARFDVDRPRPRQGQTVFVFDTSSGCPSSWSWDFGDKPSGLLNTSSSRDASHVYANPGSYTIRLVVVKGQQSFAATARITVVCARCPIVVAPRATK